MEAGEVDADGGEEFRTITGCAKPGLGSGELDGIDVESDEAAVRSEEWEEEFGVAAVAEGAVDDDVTGSGGKHFEDFPDHDGSRGAGGGFPGGDDLGDCFGVAGRIVFLVLLIEPARIPAGISGAAPVRRPRCG